MASGTDFTMTSRHPNVTPAHLGANSVKGLKGFLVAVFPWWSGVNFPWGLALSWQLGVAMGGDNFGAYVVVAWLIFLARLGKFLKMSVAHSSVERVFY